MHCAMHCPPALASATRRITSLGLGFKPLDSGRRLRHVCTGRARGTKQRSVSKY